jgi:5-methylcytosine-specific restriction endonuclease McrA
MRLEFSRKTKDEAYGRNKGICEHCGLPFGAERPEYHHIKEAYLGGDNSLANCLVVHQRCHKRLTAERRPDIDKTSRLIRKNEGRTGRKAKIKSRGFERYE